MEPDDEKTHSYIALTMNKMVGHYRIVEKIGAGGMGEVYLAQDTELDRKVALKFLPPHLCQDEDCRKRFKREAQAAAVLDHPNIAAIHEVGEFGGRPFYSMQVVEGQSLKEVIAGKDLSCEKISEIAIQVCEGLRAAHDKGIIHRDIKPSNILLDGHGRVRIVDFGLAAVRGTEQLTKTGSTLGTIGYMSPEQVQGKEIDPRSDLFSLGVVLYELITRQNPFKRDSEAATMRAVCDDAVEPIARYKRDVPALFGSIIDKLLEKNPEHRYQTAAGVIADLKRLSVHDTPSAKPRKDWWNRIVVPAAVVVLVIMMIYWGKFFRSNGSDDMAQGEKIRLVVLPFENLGDPEDEYFADGITDEITSRLTKLSALGVISRSSAIQYKKTTKSPQQIAEELDVDFMLEGTIRWDKSGSINKVRITPQLIEVEGNTHLWAENYEREISGIFDVQVEIATNIVKTLDLALAQQEQDALDAKPTDNIDAYQLYLKGMWYLWESDYTRENREAAVKLLERAVQFDPGFVEAQAAIANAHSTLYHFHFDRSEQRLELARQAIDKAVALDPNHVDVMYATGFFYYVQKEYTKALEQLYAAHEKEPKNERVIWDIACSYRRQGRFEKAVEFFNKFQELCPQRAFGFLELGMTYEELHQYQAADSCFDRAIALAPDQNQAYDAKATLCQYWKGDLQAAREILESEPGQTSVSIDTWWVQGLLERDYKTNLSRLSEENAEYIEGQLMMRPIILCAAQCYRLMGDTLNARLAFDSARVVLEPMAKNSPDDYRLHTALGFAYAGLGRKDDALRESNLSVELMPAEKDAMINPYLLREQAYTCIMIGEYQKAIEIFEQPLPYFGPGTLRLDPRLDPLRDHPRFQALLEKYEKKYGT